MHFQIRGNDPELLSITGANDGRISYAFGADGRGEQRLSTLDLGPAPRTVALAYSQRDFLAVR